MYPLVLEWYLPASETDVCVLGFWGAVFPEPFNERDRGPQRAPWEVSALGCGGAAASRVVVARNHHLVRCPPDPGLVGSPPSSLCPSAEEWPRLELGARAS